MLFGNSHEQWDLFQFPELVTRLAEAKLSFVCSATLVENVDIYAVPQALAALVAATCEKHCATTPATNDSGAICSPAVPPR
jgi:hypothetical protein